MGVNYLGKVGFAEKKFFWCTGDSKQFSELSKSQASTCKPLFDQIQCVFSGEFDKVIVSGKGTSDLVYIDADLLSKVKIPSKGLTELDRLSYVVQ